MPSMKSRCGNTLRNSAIPKESRLYKNTNLMKFSNELVPRGPHNEDQVVNILGKRYSTTVFYSLNKQGRWNFQRDLKDDYQYDADMKTCHVTMSELHMINKQNNCCEIFTTNSSVEKTASFEKPITRRGQKNKSHFNPFSNKGSRNIDAVEADENAYCHVFVDVYKPVSKHSKINHNPKLSCTKNDSWIDFTNRSSRRRLLKRHENIVWHEDSEEELELSLEEKENLDEEYWRLDDPSIRPMSFGDFMTESTNQNHSQKLKRKRTSAQSEVTKKNKIIFIVDPVEEEEESSMDRTVDIDFVPEEIAVPTFPSEKLTLPLTNLHPANLRAIFGPRVLFSTGLPRRAVIEITNNQSAYFILEKELFSENHYQLRLNSAIHDERQGHELLQRAAFSVETCGSLTELNSFFFELSPNEPMQRDAADTQATSESKVEKYIHQVQLGAWRQCQAVDENDAKEEVLNTTDEVSLSRQVRCWERRCEELVEIDECTICCEAWSTTSVNWMNRATTLACNHTFCNRCLSQHLQIAVRNGQTTISCPSNSCESLLDKATILVFLPLLQYRQHETVLFQSLLARHNYHYCPAVQCRRLLRLPQSHFNVACPCGLLLCSLCRKDPHWPATCAMASQYSSKMHELHHERLLPQEPSQIKIKGKACPICLRFIEKNLGCNHMTCLCGHQFCWYCLLPYQEHVSGPCYDSKNGRSEVKLKKHVFNSNGLLQPNGEQSRAYCKAIENRVDRVVKLKKSLNVAHACEMRLMALFLKDTDRFLRSCPVLQQKALQRIRMIRALITEICYLIEYTWVVLDSGLVSKSSQRLLKTILSDFHFYLAYFRDLFFNGTASAYVKSSSSSTLTDEIDVVIFNAQKRVTFLLDNLRI